MTISLQEGSARNLPHSLSELSIRVLLRSARVLSGAEWQKCVCILKAPLCSTFTE